MPPVLQRLYRLNGSDSELRVTRIIYLVCAVVIVVSASNYGSSAPAGPFSVLVQVVFGLGAIFAIGGVVTSSLEHAERARHDAE